MRIDILCAADLAANPFIDSDADAVVCLSFVRDSALPESQTIAEIHVLRSRFGDPFIARMRIEFAQTDPAKAERREAEAAAEIADARAVLARHGVA